jgi:hypothetical protein
MILSWPKIFALHCFDPHSSPLLVYRKAKKSKRDEARAILVWLAML